MSYNVFLENIILPLGDFFNKSTYLEQLKYWRKLDSFSEDQLETLQKENLEKILQFSTKNITAYNNISLTGENPFDWIHQFPILSKEDLKTNSEKYLYTNKKGLVKYSSSGSSGVQASVYMNKKEQSNIRAILSHWWEWSGYKIGSPIAQTGITPQRGFLKTIKDILFNTIYINAFSHSQEQLKVLCNKLKKKKNKFYLAGYASSLNIIAEYVLKNEIDIQLKSVISFGDKLFNHYKKNINKAFNCNVMDTYGCNEGFLIASQKDLEYKYIMSPHVYLEILDDNNKPVKDGEIGNVVVTRLDCFSMPLIRYKIGDLAIKLPRNEYPENREFNYPLLQKIVGRETDIIYLPNGKNMVVHSFTGIFEYIPEVKQFQVVQNDLDSITIKYIKSNIFTEEILEKVTKELQKYIKDSNFSIIYQEVEFIAPSKSGKPQMIENNIKK
ncbi:phenylacetate--CoA ligase family protein [Polaribacter haliotis]|uniref:Phenylacetate--CoA ligase family protein n=1 Tax=Polaribacter haliotis TaxID=1888915 RepID=A0A7L8AHU7_9FLAO|nr:phenylacetate--CoA ligase family protein [Polaribacter haliotis]QOD61504.1 phenylacetate--CoA ligase family protein [Polaribacter haliotis]